MNNILRWLKGLFDQTVKSETYNDTFDMTIVYASCYIS